MNIKYPFTVLLLSFVTVITFAQRKDFKVKWQNNIELRYSESNVVTVHGFQTENFNYDIDKRSVVYAANVNLPLSRPDFQIVDVQYDYISQEHLSSYDKNIISEGLGFKVQSTKSRGVLGAYVEFNPIVYRDGRYQKVLSVSVVFSQGSRRETMSSMSLPITNSEMANGEWYKFYIKKDGVYKLDRSFFSSLGVDVNSVNPQNIRLFGNGGRSIPLLNSNVNAYDVTENAVKFVGENDGVFNSGDYMLFYGLSDKGWNNDNRSHINPYTDKTYYYINVSAQNGKRIQPLSEPSTAANRVITDFDEYQYHEIDEENIVRLGRRWFGNRFDVNNNQTFSFDFERLDVSKPVNLKVFAAAAAASTTYMNVSLNDITVDNFSFSPITFATLAREDFFNGSVTVASTNIDVQLNYNNAGNPSASAYLDYIAIEGTSFLRSLDEQFAFKKNETAFLTGVGEYRISDAETVSEVWDVTDIYNVQSKVSSGESTFSFKANLGELRNYVAVVESDFYTPSKDNSSIVDNSNLKGTIFLNESGVQEDIDYLVVTPNKFKLQAERLAEINSSVQGLRTRVVTLDEIYAEFNTGNQDIGAIRNFVKYIYDNGVTDKLKYLCLFGDASFDMKDRIPNNSNYVPTFHTVLSFDLISSFMSDDFFGMLDANEGTMSSSDRLDVAVGRVLANSSQQANEMVTKVQQYYEQGAYGAWRNRMTILSDDVDDDWEYRLEQNLDDLADDIVAHRPFMNMVKLHSDAFTQETSAGGELYPAVNEALRNNIQLGSLVVNYFGHGGEDGLAHERLFQKSDAEDLRNSCKYNLFVTITCEFTRFDNPYRTTGGEITYWNPNGGAISLVTTTREISVYLGERVNEKFTEYLFDFDNTGYVSVAEALRLAKNDEVNYLKRVVFYVGDPALKLSIPDPNIKLTEINGVAITDPSAPALEALGRVTLKGEVVDAADQIITSYNGQLSTTIYDKKQQRTTLGNDGVSDSNGLLLLDYETLGEIIFRGQATVENGEFEFDFVVPRDISIPLGEGRISFYAKRNDALENQNGVNTSIKIGGVNTSAPADDLPPQIEAFMNDESFVSGGTTNESPFLLLKLSDDNGINTASGIGHDITAILDGDESNPQVLNDYYETEPDDFTKGKVKYQYNDLESGLHTLTIKAWDVYNNSITTEIQFVVVNENDKLVVERVLNYPNPFIDYTEFWFNHNSTSELDVMVQIYTVTGKLVKTLQGNSSTGNKGGNASLFRGLPWNGRDDFGDKIGKGVYVYKLTVRSTSTNKKVVKFEKLVIL
ncbi:MAG: type IX secretion system sortase PorU [Flavobacteriaceae bacterium]